MVVESKQEIINRWAAYWDTLHDVQGSFQYKRGVTRLSAFGHENIEESIGGLDLGLVEDADEIAASIFTLLGLTYALYFSVAGLKVAHNKVVGEELFKNVPVYSLVDAGIWSVNNVSSAALGAASEHTGTISVEVADVAAFSILSFAAILDTINTIYKELGEIRKIDAVLENVESFGNFAPLYLSKNFKADRQASVNKIIGASLYGASVLAGAGSYLTASVLSFTGSNALDIITNLSTAGGVLLSAGTLGFAGFRLLNDIYKNYNKSLNIEAEIQAEIKRGSEYYAVSNYLRPQESLDYVEDLRRQQRELRYETAKSVLYYSGIMIIGATSLVAGPLAGIVALLAFFAVQQACKHFVEPRIKQYFNLEKPTVAAKEQPATNDENPTKEGSKPIDSALSSTPPSSTGVSPASTAAPSPITPPPSPRPRQT